jgi:hypothetical protein
MSSINPNNIDGTYPIAGQDNDSQGFRDNFTNIKNNFTFAYDELTDLQSKVVLKSALSGGSISNDMAYAQLISPQLLKSVETKNDLGTKTGSFTISWADGHFQYYTTSGNTTLAFSNWPTSGYYTKLKLQITTDAANRTVTFPSGVKTNLGLSDILNAVGQVVTLPTVGVYLFELTTYDGGDNIAIQQLLPGNVFGNLVTRGAKVDQGVQVYRPTANVAVTANVNVSRVILAPTPSGGIVSFFADVTLPNTTVDGTVVSISSNVAVQFMRALPGWGIYTVSPSANISLSAGGSASYLLNTATSKWYKVG